VDVLVEFDADAGVGMIRLSALEIELSQILGRTVDLNTPGFLSKYYRDRVLSEDQAQYSTIAWRAIIGMRNRFVHGYNAIDLDVLWAGPAVRTTVRL